MDLVDGPKERDILVATQNVNLVVDPKSALFVSGSVLDYTEDLQKGGFKVTNPNAVAHCSCGEGFALGLVVLLFNSPFTARLRGRTRRTERRSCFLICSRLLSALL